MRLADSILRGGHLSEQALVDVCMTGERPAHLERCGVCAERALELGRWLDDVRTTATEEADAAFPPERLALQQSQILRRLEQLDRPARVIAFPSSSRYDQLGGVRQGIRPAWVGVAAAAGLAIGLLGGQFSARYTGEAPVATPAQAEQPVAPAPSATEPSSPEFADLSLDLDEIGRPQLDAVAALDAYTPHTLPASEYLFLAVAER